MLIKYTSCGEKQLEWLYFGMSILFLMASCLATLSSCIRRRSSWDFRVWASWSSCLCRANRSSRWDFLSWIFSSSYTITTCTTLRAPRTQHTHNMYNNTSSSNTTHSKQAQHDPFILHHTLTMRTTLWTLPTQRTHYNKAPQALLRKRLKLMQTVIILYW